MHPPKYLPGNGSCITYRQPRVGQTPVVDAPAEISDRERQLYYLPPAESRPTPVVDAPAKISAWKQQVYQLTVALNLADPVVDVPAEISARERQVLSFVGVMETGGLHG